MTLLTLEKATVTYDGNAVLRDVTLSIEQGERIALVGKSGAGKSTLLNLLYQQQRRRSALVPQDLGLVRVLSVFHNVFIGRLNGHSTWYNIANLIRPFNAEVEAIRQILAQLVLEDKLFAAVDQLSGGQQQRTAVARALYHEGDIFIGDEPVSNVDEHQSRVVLESINEKHETVILAMHDVELAIGYTDRIIGLEGGQIVFDQPSSSIKAADLEHLYKNGG
ncbi:MAG: ATP-binding cassette domain-containing protein [Rhodospirillaceae bacterium]|jgi:phosphonate transport system ATP-binding protein